MLAFVQAILNIEFAADRTEIADASNSLAETGYAIPVRRDTLHVRSANTTNSNKETLVPPDFIFEAFCPLDDDPTGCGLCVRASHLLPRSRFPVGGAASRGDSYLMNEADGNVSESLRRVV